MTDPDHSTELDIPPAIRAAVLARDGRSCRLCGTTPARPAIHHIVYGGTERGMGGRRVHDPAEMVTVCDSPLDARACHQLIHGDKGRWVPLLLRAARTPGVTARQLERWAARRDDETNRPFPY